MVVDRRADALDRDLALLGIAMPTASTIDVTRDEARLFGRQSFVGLESGLGRLTLGRQYSPAFVALDPGVGQLDQVADIAVEGIDADHAAATEPVLPAEVQAPGALGAGIGIALPLAVRILGIGRSIGEIDDFGTDPGRVPSVLFEAYERAIDAHVKNLRKKLDAAAPGAERSTPAVSAASAGCQAGAPERSADGLLRNLTDHVKAVARSIERVHDLVGIHERTMQALAQTLDAAPGCPDPDGT